MTAIGFLLGMRHATDPDHVVAVSTILSREGEVRRAALIGATWGVGHTLAILIVGSIMIVFRIALHPRIGLGMELAVGLMLIFLGIKNLGSLFRWSTDRITPGLREYVHDDAQGDYAHAHTSTHGHDHQHASIAAADRWFGR
ncbi:MAG TPA: hypothetical protein VHA33_30215 [Candidatus Angelobacter sp.]|jgi:high-affinity nickel-transport protein|nr:hypothetical protein [Candidatus Angelobacter sp.]